MATGTIPKGFTIYHKLLKGTTSSAGNLTTGLNTTDHILIGAATNRNQSGYYSTFYNLYPCGADASDNWFVTAVKPSDGSVMANTAIAVDIWYIANTSITVT